MTIFAPAASVNSHSPSLILPDYQPALFATFAILATVAEGGRYFEVNFVCRHPRFAQTP
jgi:hypothetical protein